MNYAFIPGIEPEFDALRTVIAKRANTQIVGGPGVVTVEDFLTHLDVLIQTLGIAKADDLIAGSHGTAEGQLFLRLDSIVPATSKFTAIPATYEDLVTVDTSKSIRIPPNVSTPNTSFRLEGCSLGSDGSVPFLQMLKQALGSPKSVSAPRYIHSLHTLDGVNFYEFMKYEFWIFGKDNGTNALPDRDAVLAAFAAAGYKFSDGSSVPPKSWDDWLPSASKLNLDPTIPQNLEVPIPVTLQKADGLPVPGALGNWVSGIEKITLPPQTGSTIPKDNAAAAAALLVSLPSDQTFGDHYAYPVYKRYHFQKLEDFVKGWNWSVSHASTTELRFIGTRYRYELWIPVTEPGTDHLIYNYYPETGSPIIHFTVGNQPKLFGVV